MLDKEGINNEIIVGVTFASLMAAVSIFFTGLLIAQFHSFGPTIKVPLLLLIVSTFSFIFVATIYNNASTEVTLGKLKTVEKYMVYAKNIVEFLGLYPLILSMPLVIGAVTQDSFLRVSTGIVAIGGLTLYTQSRFSILEKQLPVAKKRIYSIFIIMLALFLYFSQSLAQFSAVFSYTNVALFLLVSLLIPATYFSLRSKQYKITLIRMFKDSDAPELSELIKKNMSKVRGGKYSEKIVELILGSSSEAAIRKIASEEQVFVALFGGKPAGVASLKGNKLHAVFTDPDLHRKGIGRMLVETVEVAVAKHGYKYIEVYSSSIDYKFYERLGYAYVGEDHDGRPILRKQI